jgi:hypothetical protein
MELELKNAYYSFCKLRLKVLESQNVDGRNDNLIQILKDELNGKSVDESLIRLCFQ